jgi:hypothetical protein
MDKVLVLKFGLVPYLDIYGKTGMSAEYSVSYQSSRIERAQGPVTRFGNYMIESCNCPAIGSRQIWIRGDDRSQDNTIEFLSYNQSVDIIKGAESFKDNDDTIYVDGKFADIEDEDYDDEIDINDDEEELTEETTF